MKTNNEFILSLDIGGANTKFSLLFLDFEKYIEETEEEDRHFYKSILASYENLYFSTIYFPFWMKQKKDFILVLKKIKKSIEDKINKHIKGKSEYLVVVTITAELSDAFNTKKEGISEICEHLTEVFDETKIRLINIDSEFLTIKEAKADYLSVSASNWVGTSMVFGEREKLGILLDMGSTTLDLIPIKDGRPVTIGKTDVERLLNYELLYTGILRAPIPSITHSVPFRNSKCPISFERFAIMADIYRILGLIDEHDYTCDTADGRGKSLEECYARVSRMLCGDLMLIKLEEIDEIASYIYRSQKNMVKDSIVFAIDQFVRRFVVPTAKIKFNITGLGANIVLIPVLKELYISDRQIILKGLSKKEHLISSALCLGIVFLKKLMEERDIISIK